MRELMVICLIIFVVVFLFSFTDLKRTCGKAYAFNVSLEFSLWAGGLSFAIGLLIMLLIQFLATVN